MRALVLFNVDFAAWPVHILAALRRRLPAFTADGIVVVDPTVTSWLAGQPHFAFERLTCLSKLEPAWIARAFGASEVAAGTFPGGLHPAELALIAIGDRELTDAWSGGAVTATSPLRRAAAEPEVRRAYIAGLVELLDAAMRERRYDLVFCYSVQDGPSVAAALVAEKHGIPFLSPKAIGFQALTCLFDDVRTMRPCFRHAFARAATDRTAIPERDWEAGRRALERFHSRPEGPDYMTLANATTFERPSLLLSLSLLRRSIERRPPVSLRYPTPSSRLRWEWRRWIRARRDRHHPLFRSLADLGPSPFAYFPLHYEPEASLLVSAPENVDQMQVIRAAAAALPPGWRLAVKEHRPMLGRRPAGYYERLARIPRVVLVSPFEDGLAMVRGAKVTLTITGTAGFEAVLLGRPVLFLGPSPIHVIGHGFVHEPDLARIGPALTRALAEPAADDATLVRFLAALTAASVDVPSRLIWGGTAVITSDLVQRQPAEIERFADLILAALIQQTPSGT